jgi:hypothetical protein
MTLWGAAGRSKTPCLPWRAYYRRMVQSWGVSRFNGHISSLGASIERAGVQLACVAASIAQSEAAFMPVPMGRLDRIDMMRALVAATAVAALALLILILL